MHANVSMVFNVMILLFIGFEILNSAFDAKTTVSNIKLPQSFLLSDRENYENYQDAITTLAALSSTEEEEPEDLSLTVAYSEYTNPHRPVDPGPSTDTESSYYLEWIRKDLEPWLETGITEELIDAGAHNWSCAGERLRFHIIGGKLYVEHLSWRPREGWYPARLGPGNMSAKGKVPYVIFALLDTLRAYPGQIPDVEVAIHTADFPCIHRNPDGRPPPVVMASNSGNKFADIVFPDYSYYGHEHSWLWGPDDTYMMGWEAQYQLTAQKWANFTLLDRVPQVMWRGRTFDAENPQRDAMRRAFTECPSKFLEAGHADDAALWNVDGGSYMLTDLGDFRYNMYLESEAWVTNLRLKLSCGSVMVSNRMEYHEFFTRALAPGYHYVEVDQNNMCAEAVSKIKAMEQRLHERAGELPKGANFPVEEVWDWAKLSYSDVFMAHLNASAAPAIAGPTRRLLVDRLYTLKQRRPHDDEVGGDDAAGLGGLGAGLDVPPEAERHAADGAPEDPLAAAAAAVDEAAAGAAIPQAIPSIEPTDEAAAVSIDPALDPDAEEGDAAGDEGDGLVAGVQPEAPVAAGGRSTGLTPPLLEGGLTPMQLREQLAGEADKHIWGKAEPWEIPENSAKFVRDHVRMADVRRYIRDLLREYAALQTFKPAPKENSVCYTGALLLEQFGNPHKRDAHIMRQSYPWLQAFDPGCPKLPQPGEGGPYSQTRRR